MAQRACEAPLTGRSDPVHRRSRGLFVADDLFEGAAGECALEGVAGAGEGGIGVGAEGAVDRFDDLQEADLGDGAGEEVAAADAALAAEDSGALELHEELLELGEREVGAAGDFGDGDGFAVTAGAGQPDEGTNSNTGLVGDEQHAPQGIGSGGQPVTERQVTPSWAVCVRNVRLSDSVFFWSRAYAFLSATETSCRRMVFERSSMVPSQEA